MIRKIAIYGILSACTLADGVLTIITPDGKDPVPKEEDQEPKDEKINSHAVSKFIFAEKPDVLWDDEESVMSDTLDASAGRITTLT